MIVDLSLDEHPERMAWYVQHPGIPVLGCQVKAVYPQYTHIYGCNWLPGFIGMPKAEVSLPAGVSAEKLNTLMQQLGWLYETVAPSVGMVTPRMVCMIINEAYFTAEEGTASREDIDISMKLGTNYPFGPFEWCRRIGIRHVYEVLEAVYASTGDERYRICALLQQEYTAQQL